MKISLSVGHIELKMKESFEEDRSKPVSASKKTAKKFTVHQFEPVIYPRKLWICISHDGVALNGMFLHYETKELMRFEEYDIKSKEALVFPVIDRRSDYAGVLIVFTKRKYMTCKTIAHEAVHAAGYIFQHIGQKIDFDESFAFLTGWIANCCWIIRNGKAE
jgi:hypothetical protein